MTPGPNNEGYGPEMRRLLEMARVYGMGSPEFVRKIEKRRKAKALTDDESAALYLQEHGVRFANDALVGWPMRSPPTERVLQRAVYVVVRRWDLQARARWITRRNSIRTAAKLKVFEERYKEAKAQPVPTIPPPEPQPEPERVYPGVLQRGLHGLRRLFGR